MISVRKARMSDFEAIKMDELLSPFTQYHVLRHGVKAMMTSNSVMAIEAKDKAVLALADTFPYKDGVYMWAFYHGSARNYCMALARIARHTLGMYNGTKIYAHVNTKYTRSVRFIKFLGFKLHTNGDIVFNGQTYDLYDWGTNR